MKQKSAEKVLEKRNQSSKKRRKNSKTHCNEMPPSYQTKYGLQGSKERFPIKAQSNANFDRLPPNEKADHYCVEHSKV